MARYGRSLGHGTLFGQLETRTAIVGGKFTGSCSSPKMAKYSGGKCTGLGIPSLHWVREADSKRGK